MSDQPQQAQKFSVPIDGRIYTIQDLTFRERRELRSLCREAMGKQDAELADVYDDVDIVPQFIYVIRRRSDSGYTLEQAMELSLADIERERAELGPPDEAAEAASSTP